MGALVRRRPAELGLPCGCRDCQIYWAAYWQWYATAHRRGRRGRGHRVAGSRPGRRWDRRQVLNGLRLLVGIPAGAWVLAALSEPADQPRPPSQPGHTTGRKAKGAAAGQGTGAARAPDRVVAEAVGYALAQRGKRYVWGAEGPDAFDCSGLVWAAYHHAGLGWGRSNAAGLCAAGPRVPGGLAAAHRGDLVFFHSSGPSGWHVGLLLDPGRMIHAPNRRAVVRVEQLTAAWRRRVRAITRPGLLAA